MESEKRGKSEREWVTSREMEREGGGWEREKEREWGIGTLRYNGCERERAENPFQTYIKYKIFWPWGCWEKTLNNIFFVSFS